MDDPGTDSLRKLAPSWTLAGDEQLLSILQNTHQRLLAKCQEANCQLEQMATALNDASISLQNVNNQFMALSSSQFIESRVYDDDDLITEIPAIKEPPKPDVPDELTSLKRSIAVLENAHEIITILQDSDTESDTDDEMPARLVLKPKDMYAERPLPYIIGTQPWKNKWHAGLLLEDSDSESSTSKVEHDSDQYSHSEPEDTHTDKLRVPDTHTTVSETSSELPSEQGSIPKPTPSDVASEIARRLGAREPHKMVEREPEYEEPVKPTVRKIYRPQEPVSSTIFPDEPPPLSEHSDSQESDIFAELHRSQPYARAQLTDDLFGFNDNDHDSDDGDIFSDFANKPVTNPSAKPTSLFDAGPAPHMFDKQHTDNTRKNVYDDHRPDDRRTGHVYDEQRPDRGVGNADEMRRDVDAEADRGVKKPVGGISLFGKKGTESIGAAILKRNQRKSSSSGDESESDSRSESLSNQQIRKEKDIFDDLFARSEGKKVTKDKVDVVKDIKTEIQKKNEEKVKDKKVEKAKVDLFSDNLFDDVDDIFSTNVVKMPAKDNTKTKSIFEDDDDLFSEISAPKPVKIEVASSSNNKKSLFDSDDELFSENVPKTKPDETPKPTPKAVEVSKPIVAERSKPSEPPKVNKDTTRSIFDDDDDELFSDVPTNKINEVIKVQNNTPLSIEKSNVLSKEVEQSSKNIALPSSNVFKSPSLFDDDDESDLFTEPAKSSHIHSVTGDHSEDSKKLTSKNDVLPQDNLDVDIIPSSLVKTDDLEQNVVKSENDNLNRDSSKPIESIVNNIDASESMERSIDLNTSVLPVSENVHRKNSDTNFETNAAKIFDHIQQNMQNIEQSSSDTNNDFSDQDFDDLPPKEETDKNLIINSNIVTETINNEIPADIHNIFDKTTLEEDIDKIFAKAEQNTDNTESIFTNTEPDFTQTIFKDSKKTERDNKTDQIVTKNIETDVFSDILTEPPVFEKPKEPKRSKNVNALFDDDSDDESLFFKKNDPIFEEHPEDFTPTQDRLFGLFTNEPPDDGFSKISDDLDNDIFGALPKPKIPQNANLPPKPHAVNFEDSISIDVKIPDIENVDPVEDIFKELPKAEAKPVLEIPKEPKLHKQNYSSDDIFKQPNTVNVEHVEQQPGDEQLFKIPTSKPKPSLLDKSSPDILSDDENLFTSVPKLEKSKSSVIPKDEPVPENKILGSDSKFSDDEPFTSLSKVEKPQSDNELVKQDLKSDEDIFKVPKNKPEFIPKSAEIPPKETKPEKSEQKKVGKLKVGLNINVNALLPGASPKKVKPNDQTDGQTQSVTENKKVEPKIYPEVQKSEPIVPESQNTDSKLLKSVSFDGKPESDVLDNKLSKERAKIQVKRRPSTRRARREAVRKSGIDFGEDSTDNSSSIDDPPRITPGKQPDISHKTNEEDANEHKEIRQNVQAESLDKSEVQAKPNDTTKHAEIQPKIVEPQTSHPENIKRQAEISDKPHSRDVKSKVVYILNDEDIFNTSPEKPEINNKNVTADTSKKSEYLETSTGVTTLGKVYDKTVTINDISTSKKDKNTSLFGDENDEEIFKAKTIVKKSGIFDSDSEEELFGTSKREIKKVVEKIEVKKEIKREVVKRSLFGDDEDDDDLFGIKTKEKKSVEQKPQPSKSTAKETPKPAEPVFEDPLSMFGDDD